MGKGGKYSPSTLPAEPLVLWGYEPSPFTRVVRERIVELALPHLFKPTCRGSANRQAMFDKYGKFQAPLLEVRKQNRLRFSAPRSRCIRGSRVALMGPEKEKCV